MSSVDTVISRAWQVLQERPAALITDIDGTISRIAPTPEEAFVGEPARTALRSLLPHLDLVAVVTGRESSVAQSMVAVEGLEYVGNYALDNTTAQLISPEAIHGARDAVASLLAPWPCVRLEDKDVSFALHYRECEDRPAARRELLALASPIAQRSGAKIVEGKQVVEIVPAALPDKGTAVKRLLEQHNIAGIVYFGDDLGDVAVFKELARLRATSGLSALSIAVVDAETDISVLENADTTLDGVDAVEEVMTALAGKVAGGGEGWPRE